MTQIIKFTDVNVDGCGTDIEMLVQVEGKTKLTDDIIKETKAEIEKYKDENYYEWDTNSVIDVACECLELQGFACKGISPDYCIEF